jgi:hypothetical protein
MSLVPMPRIVHFERPEEEIHSLGFQQDLRSSQEILRALVVEVSIQPSLDSTGKLRVAIFLERDDLANFGESPKSEKSVLTLLVNCDPRELPLLSGLLGRKVTTITPKSSKDKSYEELLGELQELRERYSYLQQTLREFSEAG